jgi:hypothetical protein
MWVFRQATGSLEHNGKEIAGGYSGARGLGVNRYEKVPWYGPIPTGFYVVSRSPLTQSHYYVLSLTPKGHDAQGRTSFLIHGDYREGDSRKGNASAGCIILPLEVRQAIWDSYDHVMAVQM